jgi:hypothetical protein
MATLVTLVQVKNHLLIPIVANDPGDPDLQLKLDAAEAAILDYVGATAYWAAIVSTWLDGSVTPPWFVLSAILLQCGELWRFRGDDLNIAGPMRTPGQDFSDVVVNLLRRVHDPVVV